MVKMMRTTIGKFLGWWTGAKVALILGVMGLVSGVIGYTHQHPEGFTFGQFVADYYTNISTDLVSIALTVLLIDSLERRRDEEERIARERTREQIKLERYKQNLIRQMGSKINGEACRAVEKLRGEGWLEDGSLVALQLRDANLENADLRWACLKRAQLYRANLRGANLFGADLEGAHLAGANLTMAQMGQINLLHAYLEGADLRGARKLSNAALTHAARLKGTIMPDGNRYNGCFNLRGDLNKSRKAGINPADPNAMAAWYDVSVESYLRGQEWAEAHLAQLRTRAALRESQTAEVEP